MKLSHLSLLATAICFGATIMAAQWTAAPVAAASASVAVPVAIHPAPAFAASELEEDCLRCEEIIVCDEDQHLAYNPGPTPHVFQRKDGSHPSTCWPEECLPDKHPLCGETAPVPEVVEAARTAVEALDSLALAQVINDYSEVVHLNHTRHAIQITDCTDQVVAHLPADLDFLEATANALAGLIG